LFLCNDIIISATAIHFLALSCDNAFRISPKTLGGDFIQEGADNIDLNTETIDGKNTMHSMARAVFQVVKTLQFLLSHGLRHWSKTVSLQCKKHKYQMHEGFQLNV
jgi:hypothetical protein